MVVEAGERESKSTTTTTSCGSVGCVCLRLFLALHQFPHGQLIENPQRCLVNFWFTSGISASDGKIRADGNLESFLPTAHQKQNRQTKQSDVT